MGTEFFNKWAPWFMDKLIHDFALSVEDAAAIIGNAGHESGGFQSLQELKPLVKGSRGGYGIMQWTGPRRRDFEAYCERNKLKPSDMETNYKFLFVELQGPEGKALDKLRKEPDLAAKTQSFMLTFLRPGIPHLDQRITWAKRAMAAYDKAPVEKPSAPATPPMKSKRVWSWLAALGGINLVGFGGLHWGAQLAIVLCVSGIALYALVTIPAVRDIFKE